MKKLERKIDVNKWVAAFSITTLVFVLGIFLGNFLAQSKLSGFKESYEKLRTQILGLELRDRLLEYKNICDLTWEDMWKEKIELGDLVGALESRLGKNNEEVLRQKELYQLIEIRTWLLLKEREEKCGENFTIILFFYTNRERDTKGSWKESEEQGYVLDTLYRKNPYKIRTFVFDVNIDNLALNTLKEMHEIKKVPVLVINGEVYKGFRSLEEVKRIIG